jgi:hypothetical protein
MKKVLLTNIPLGNKNCILLNILAEAVHFLIDKSSKGLELNMCMHFNKKVYRGNNG